MKNAVISMENCGCYNCGLRGAHKPQIVCYAESGKLFKLQRILEESKKSPWIVNFARRWEEVMIL